MEAGTAKPFGPGSIAFGLHPLTQLPGAEQAATMVSQAQAAERAGFDGVTVSEHHAGFPGYMAQPLLASNWVLAGTSGVWAGPCPLLLPFRNPVLMAEECAWTSARYPGRFGAGFAPGYAPSDFEAVGAPADERFDEFASRLSGLVAALRTGSPVEADPAVAAWISHPAPLLSTANTPTAAERAADLGLGLVYPGGADADRTGLLTSRYRDAGGTGPVVCIRNVWLGDPPADAYAELEAVFRRAVASATRRAPGFDEPLVSGPAQSVLDRLASAVGRAGATSLNVRFHLPGVEAEQVDEQVNWFGEALLASLRATLGTGPG